MWTCWVLGSLLLATHGHGYMDMSNGSGSGRGDDCKTVFVYQDQHTSSAIPQPGITSLADCQDECFIDTACLSFNYDPTKTDVCWMQFDPLLAYTRFARSLLINVELPCRVPDLGCPYEFVANTMPVDTGVDVGVGQLGSCHDACLSDSTCLAWVWNVGGAPRCLLYSQLTGETAATDIHLYIMTCRATTPTPVTVADDVCGYRRFAGMYAMGGDIVKTATTYNQCELECASQSDCFGFNYDTRSSTAASARCALLEVSEYQNGQPLTGVDLYQEVCPCMPMTTAGPVFPTMSPGWIGLPGPTTLPSGWLAYPGYRVTGGLGVSAGILGVDPAISMIGDDCTGECMYHPDCAGYDYNMNAGYCYLHFDSGVHNTNNICDETLLSISSEVYHVKKAACPSPYPPAIYVMP